MRGASTGRGGAAGRGGSSTGRGDAARRGGSSAGHGVSGPHAGRGSGSGANSTTGPLIPVGDPVGEIMARLGALDPRALSMNGTAVDDTQYEMDSDDDERGMLDDIQDFERRLTSGACLKAPSHRQSAVPSCEGNLSASAAGKELVPVQRRQAPQQQQQQQQQQSMQMRLALQVVKDSQPSSKPRTKSSKPEVDAVDNDADRDDVSAAMRDLDRFDYGQDSDDDEGR